MPGSQRLTHPLSGSGAAMSCAMPSTMAVLPTPASPISSGLCLERRSSTYTNRAARGAEADQTSCLCVLDEGLPRQGPWVLAASTPFSQPRRKRLASTLSCSYNNTASWATAAVRHASSMQNTFNSSAARQAAAAACWPVQCTIPPLVHVKTKCRQPAGMYWDLDILQCSSAKASPGMISPSPAAPAVRAG